MSIQVHVDSTWRNRREYESPADFAIPLDIVDSWKTVDRTVQAVKSCNQPQIVNALHTVKLLHITIPASAVGTLITGATFVADPIYQTTQTGLVADMPFIYVAFNSLNMRDDSLINTMEGGKNSANKSLKQASFVCYLDKIQFKTGTTLPMWLQYKTPMLQSYRIDTKNNLRFRVFDNTGNTLIISDEVAPTFPDASHQINALFELTPYIRDDRYDNHLASVYRDRA